MTNGKMKTAIILQWLIVEQNMSFQGYSVYFLKNGHGMVHLRSASITILPTAVKQSVKLQGPVVDICILYLFCLLLR